jgi:hypothetical protein
MSLKSITATALLAVLLPIPALAATDLVFLNRSQFPERPWTPLTPGDGATVGAGRAVDPGASWSRNPALLTRAGVAHVRLGALALDPQRNDIRAQTDDYTDTSPFVSVGESAARWTRGNLALGVYLAQDAYQRSKEVYLTTVPSFGPVLLESRGTTSRARFGLGAGFASGPLAAGVALEGNRVREDLEFLPSEEAQGLGAIPARNDVHGISLGAAAGAAWQAHPLVLVGVDARFASSPKLKDESGAEVGSDEVPPAVDLGVHVGKGRGGNLLLGASYEGARDVALGDSVGRGVDRDPERVEVAGAYMYRPAEASWEFRGGFGWSPHPKDGGARYTRTGVGLGYDLDGILVRLSYSRDARRDQGRNSSRNWFGLGVDLKL